MQLVGQSIKRQGVKAKRQSKNAQVKNGHNIKSEKIKMILNR